MVVGMIYDPVPASSIREATPEESEAYIDEWIKDIAIHFPDFAPNALAYAEALCVMGYTSKSSLHAGAMGKRIKGQATSYSCQDICG